MRPDNEIPSGKYINRRKFLKCSILSGIAAGKLLESAGSIPGQSTKGINPGYPDDSLSGNEVIYNGITLPGTWPPEYMNPDAYDPMPVPYLTLPPEIILTDTGRQLFIDDFLVEYTDLKRKFHQPVKYEKNPVLIPATSSEMNSGLCPVAAPFSDGCFYDPADKLFKLWYMAGWFDGTALATSPDGLHWNRPDLNIVPGTNLVLAPQDDLRRDGASVWLDHETKDPDQRFKMYLYTRKGKLGEKLNPHGGFLLTSPDGINWKKNGLITGGSDNNTFFYNPFRKKWVFTIRKEGRPIPPWSDLHLSGKGRARSYWENENFQSALNKWDGSVFWFGADRLDKKRENYAIGEDPQIYKVDAVGYESIMLGLIQLHYGPSNEKCAKSGFPKLTELQLAFSRDGFHWDRSNRETFIGAHPDQKDSWERAYIHSVGGTCNIVNDKLYFYYTAFRGNESNPNPLVSWNGMYANGSTGLAILRRDGFASMETEDNGFLLTRLIKFSGKFLFVNIDGPSGRLTVEICGKDGIPYPGFTTDECVVVRSDSTNQRVTWQKNENIEQFAGKAVRLKFHLTNSKLYAFWTSNMENGASGGATAAGGPGLAGTWDI